MSVFDIPYTRLDGGTGVFDRRTVLQFKEHVPLEHTPLGWRVYPPPVDRDVAMDSSTLFRVGNRWVLWEMPIIREENDRQKGGYEACEVNLGEAAKWFNRRTYAVIEGWSNTEGWRKTVAYGVGIPDVLIEELHRAEGTNDARPEPSETALGARGGSVAVEAVSETQEPSAATRIIVAAEAAAKPVTPAPSEDADPGRAAGGSTRPPSPPEPAPAKPPGREPSKMDWEAYRLYTESRLDQAAVAKTLEKEYGLPFDQPKVSRMIARVRKHKGEAKSRKSPRVHSVDPSRLDLGPRGK